MPAEATVPTVVTPTVAGSVRMGFGIALGMLLLGLLVAIVVCRLGVDSGAITWPFADRARRFEGRGPAESTPITLEGAIAIEWSASPTSPVACLFPPSLRMQNDPAYVVEIANTHVDQGLGSGIPRELSLQRRSDYYLRVELDCDWAIRVIDR